MQEGSWVGEWDQRPAGQGRGGGCLLSGPFARLPMFPNISSEERILRAGSPLSWLPTRLGSWSTPESSPSEMPGVGGWLCLELGDSLSILLKVFCLKLSPQPSALQNTFPWLLWPQASLSAPVHPSRAPGCPWHGPKGQVPGATPVGAPGPAGACLGETRPCLPCARPHWGPAGGLVSLAPGLLQ